MARYERFWDLHVIASDGTYDFANQVQEQVDYQHRRHGQQLRQSLNLVNVTSASTVDPRAPNRAPSFGLPREGGVVASAVKASDLNALRATATDKALIKWISDIEFVGKLRINAHGDGRGHIYMPPDEVPVNAEKLVSWLQANGLDKPIWISDDEQVQGGLATVSMAVCMGAMYETEAPQWSTAQGQYVAADYSAVHRVKEAFHQLGHRFVKVTGSNELVTTDQGEWKRRNPFGHGGLIDGWDYDNVPALDPESPAPVKPVGTFKVDISRAGNWVRLTVPMEFTVLCRNRQSVIEVPRSWTIEGDGARGPGGGGFRLTCRGKTILVPEGWIVDVDTRRLILPLGVQPGGLAGRIVTPEGDWRVSGHHSLIFLGVFGQPQRLAHTAYKVKALS
ncbi:hypothetical protein [Archangium sp.]|uniref:hypothetical protein n=1 Tax=Archangium sp. TaxID=1872627 RepID=UPI00286C6D34|nr:hypothetical protein [Archangium sp.]